MAITHKVSANAATLNPTTTWTVGLNAIATGDDLYIAVTSRDHTSGTARVTCTDNDTGGNTWTLIAESTDRKASLFWKKATSATDLKTATIAGAVGSSTGGYSAYRGAAPTPHTNISVQDNAAGAETHTGFTPDVASSMICLVVFNTNNDNLVTTPACTDPGTLLQRYSHLSTGGSDCSNVFTSQVQAGGPTATGNFTWAQTDGTTKSIVFAIKPQRPPTVVVNSPPDGTSTIETLPVLEFTGTDPDADSIRYHLQFDSLSSFDSTAYPDITVDSYSESNQSALHSMNSANAGGAGQSFTPSLSGLLDRAIFYLKKTGSPTGSAVAKVYAHSGTYGSTSVPTGAALATSDNFDVSTLTTSLQLITFTFSGANIITLNAATNYVVTVEHTGDASNYVSVGHDFSAPTDVGNFFSKLGGSWTPASNSHGCFYVILDTVGPLLDKLSGTDSGFANTVNGGDTDPFNSGEKVSFTMTTPVEPRKYYWRVRVIDPLGTNTWSAWSQTRFVVSEELIPNQTLAADTTTTGSADVSAEMPEQYDVSSTVSEVTDTVMDMTVSSKTAEGETPQQQAVIGSIGGESEGNTTISPGIEASVEVDMTGAGADVEVLGTTQLEEE